MPRPNPIDQLNRSFNEAFGSKALTTQKGLPSYQKKGTNAKAGADILVAALRPESSIPFEKPSRDIILSYLVQEQYAVCSVFSSGVDQMAGDASQDAMADDQPYTIMIRGESGRRKDDIYETLDDGLRKAKVGVKTYQRNRRAMKTGICVGEPVFSRNSKNDPWYMSDVINLPSWEMHCNPQTRIWSQIRQGTMGNQTIAVWDKEGPNYLATSVFKEDDNYLHGVPIGAQVMVDYKLQVMALEDLAVGGRSRACLRIAYSIGEEGRIADPATVARFKRINESQPISIVGEHYLRAGLEKAEVLRGDPAGVKALLEICLEHQNRMRMGIGMPPIGQTVTGMGLEEVEAKYARNINLIRQMDARYVKSVGDKILALRGYLNVDWYIQIPSLGETESTRTTRASKELDLGHIGMEEYAATTGHKSAQKLMESITENVKFRKKLFDEYGMPMPGTSGGGVAIQADRQDVVGTESKKKGADAQKGRNRRKQQKDAGREPTGA